MEMPRWNSSGAFPCSASYGWSQLNVSRAWHCACVVEYADLHQQSAHLVPVRTERVIRPPGNALPAWHSVKHVDTGRGHRSKWSRLTSDELECLDVTVNPLIIDEQDAFFYKFARDSVGKIASMT